MIPVCPSKIYEQWLYIYVKVKEMNVLCIYQSESGVLRHILSPRHVLSQCGDKSCRKVHSPHVLSSLRQQRSISPSFLFPRCACVCVRVPYVRAHACVRAYALALCYVLFLVAKECETEILYCFE